MDLHESNHDENETRRRKQRRSCEQATDCNGTDRSIKGQRRLGIARTSAFEISDSAPRVGDETEGMNNPQSRSRILLTGATGFIGRRLRKALELRGHDIVTMSRRAPDDWANVINIDLSHQEVPTEQLKTIETVYHLAGYAHDLSDPSQVADRYRALNIEGTLRLARASIAAGVKRFIFVSSVKAGGITATGLDMDETSIAQPDGIYGETKRRAEEELFRLTKSETMTVTVIRPALVYGPAVKGNLALMLKGIEAGWFPPNP